MTRRAGARPDNPWQRATALGKRLRVTADRGERDAGDVWGLAMWTHPDGTYRYVIDLEGDTATWLLVRLDDRGTAHVLEEGTLEPDTAALYVTTARNAEPRRLAAWKMLNAIALEGATWEGPNA